MIRGGRLVEAHGALLRGRGLRLRIGDLVRVGDVLAETVGFIDQDALLAPMASAAMLANGDRFTRVFVPALSLPFGRIIDALGQPFDRGGPLVVADPVAAPTAMLPSDRAPVDQPFVTGVRAIDALLTLGRGQRVAVAAPAGVGKTTLLHHVLRTGDADAVVVALIGERGREVAEFANAALTGPHAARTIIVAATSDQAPALRLRAADRAHAIAQALASAGQSVLLLFDSMTRVAQAQREIGLALGEAAAMGAYPPSAFALIPRLVERAGGDLRTGGAVTALYTVLAEAGDRDDPILDALRAATDGHIVLSRTLAEHGIYPAIDLAASLSRTMPAVVTPEHLADARRARRLWSLAEEMRELQQMGAYTPGSDSDADLALDRRDALLGFVAQGDAGADFVSSRAALAELVA